MICTLNKQRKQINWIINLIVVCCCFLWTRWLFFSRMLFIFFTFFTDTSKAEIKLFTSKISFNAMELFYICVGIGAASSRAEFCYEVKYWYFDYSCRFTMASLFVMFRITWHFIDPDCARACYKLDIGGHVKRELPSSNRSEISELKTCFLFRGAREL